MGLVTNMLFDKYKMQELKKPKESQDRIQLCDCPFKYHF